LSREEGVFIKFGEEKAQGKTEKKHKKRLEWKKEMTPHNKWGISEGFCGGKRGRRGN